MAADYDQEVRRDRTGTTHATGYKPWPITGRYTWALCDYVQRTEFDDHPPVNEPVTCGECLALRLLDDILCAITADKQRQPPGAATGLVLYAAYEVMVILRRSRKVAELLGQPFFDNMGAPRALFGATFARDGGSLPEDGWKLVREVGAGKVRR